ncbi:histidine biosynthesis trifunctional-protein [Serendipita vermifera]|nr:histidine biosynthesis trifunctional-protein [Serendipita vermifera]
MTPFLPLLARSVDKGTKDALQRLGPLILTQDYLATRPDSSQDGLTDEEDYFVLADANSHPDKVAQWLDDGAQKVILPATIISKLVSAGSSNIPSNRLVLSLDMAEGAAVPDKLRSAVSGLFIKCGSLDATTLSSFKQFFPGAELYVQPQQLPSSNATLQAIKDATRMSVTLVIPTENLTLGDSNENVTNIADAFIAPLASDRADGLFPTVVTSYTSNRCLGLVYSSAASIKESINTGKGVYQSRKHGLWRKGETSGATQEVVSIRTDCDSDSLEFTVVQRDPGFCHLNRQSCFGELDGLAQLESTLLSRLSNAPPGSYTRRLFDDEDLLRKKIREEADELCSAQTKEDIAFEAADLLYFALVKCVKNEVRLKDVEGVLNQKAKKITRRKGDAKSGYPGVDPPHVNGTPSAPPPLQNGIEKPLTNGYHPPASSDSSAPTTLANGTSTASVNGNHDRIQMKIHDLSKVNPKQRLALLQRPVLKSDDMIAKVRPIVDRVRTEGDAALRELTAKFDKANLNEVLIRPPFYNAKGNHCLDGQNKVVIDESVRVAIDKAYGNINRFHSAQNSPPLVVETMPGITCQRFAKAISRVGLYVPGGTAVLPSTALMLGIPAQVAGCKEIVIATPPRPDGNVSAEVLYVAHLVGASGILKAGGAQAVGALAYGTETVPKVDKIFGPGNQWVTAAKMMVQNDSDAMVAIDMPAGPSEVLVMADNSSNPAFVAADLLSQAEHGEDSQVVLVGINLSPEQLSAIEDEVDKQAHALPRVDIVRKSIGASLVVLTKSLQQAMDFSNDYAPEHLIINLENTEGVLDLVENAGSVFIGQYTPESCGDYASGTNHTLPTNGFARQYSGVNTYSFQKHITSQEITPDGLKGLGPVVTTLADCEGLDAHGNAVRVRLAALGA